MKFFSEMSPVPNIRITDSHEVCWQETTTFQIAFIIYRIQMHQLKK